MKRFAFLTLALSFSSIAIAGPNDVRIHEHRYDLNQGTQTQSLNEKEEHDLKLRDSETAKTFSSDRAL